MFSPTLSARLDVLIDDLILDGSVESASLASILLAAKDSVKRDYHVMLSRWVWAATNEMDLADREVRPSSTYGQSSGLNTGRFA